MERVFKRGSRCPRAVPHERAGCARTQDDGRVAPQRSTRVNRIEVAFERARQPARRVDSHERGTSWDRDHDLRERLVDHDALTSLAADFIRSRIVDDRRWRCLYETDLEFAMKRGPFGIDWLVLFDTNTHHAVGGVIACRDRKIRVTGATDPLIEKPADVSASFAFCRAGEIDGLDCAVLIIANVARDCSAKTLLAERAPKTVDDRARLLVGVPVEEFERPSIAGARYGADVPCIRFLQVRLELFADIEDVVVPAVPVLGQTASQYDANPSLSQISDHSRATSKTPNH